MILFHRFSDLTDELFTRVLPSVQKGGERAVEKERTKKFQRSVYVLEQFLFQKSFLLFFPTNPHQLSFVNIS